MTTQFDAVPTYQGIPLLEAYAEDEYWFYLSWLADYLYRPSQDQVIMTEGEATREIIGVEIEMADWLWTHPGETFPTPAVDDPNAPAHADFYYREAISQVLSAVPDKQYRIQLIHRLYREFNIDSYK